MRKIHAIFIFIFMYVSSGICELTNDFFIDWKNNDGSPVDLSFLLDKPAGTSGNIIIKDGHLATPDGRRFRIWGVNLTAGACFPEKQDAQTVAKHLARYGINCVRFHFLDSAWGTGRSLFIQGSDNTQQFDTSQLDKLDYFVAQLKKHGIYSNFNLNVGRNFRKDDGVADWQYIGLAKAITIFDKRVIELEKDYSRRLLCHVNPYTKNEYRQEPALAIVELLNENSLIEAWFSDRLVGRGQTKADGTWAGITNHYAKQLDERYNRWLRENLSTDQLARLKRAAGVDSAQPLPRLKSSEFSKADKLRFTSEAKFYMELEDRFFTGMYNYLKDHLKIKQLVVGTSDHNHYRSGYAMLSSAGKLDIVDGHVYWQHPSKVRDPETGKQGFWIANTPMVNDPFNSSVVQLARSKVAGKPYTVSETNHPYPNEYTCEGIGILAAYGLLQDWDGVFLYTFAHENPQRWETKTPGHFDIGVDPVKMTNCAAAALLFHRGDISAADKSMNRSYSIEQVIEGIRAGSRNKPFFTECFNSGIALMHRTHIESFNKDIPRDYYRIDVPVPDPIVSDTRQLKWYRADGKGLVTIDTPRTQALIGFVGENPKKLGNLSAEVKNNFCSIIVTSIDGKNISQSGKMLLAVTSTCGLRDMQFNDKRTTLTNWGRLPFRIEPVKGSITLRKLSAARSVKAVALDGAGKPIGSSVDASSLKTGWKIILDQATTWYLISVEKQY